MKPPRHPTRHAQQDNDLEICTKRPVTASEVGISSDITLPVLLDEPALLSFFSRPWFK